MDNSIHWILQFVSVILIHRIYLTFEQPGPATVLLPVWDTQFFWAGRGVVTRGLTSVNLKSKLRDCSHSATISERGFSVLSYGCSEAICILCNLVPRVLSCPSLRVGERTWEPGFINFCWCMYRDLTAFAVFSVDREPIQLIF